VDARGLRRQRAQLRGAGTVERVRGRGARDAAPEQQDGAADDDGLSVADRRGTDRLATQERPVQRAEILEAQLVPLVLDDGVPLGDARVGQAQPDFALAGARLDRQCGTPCDDHRLTGRDLDGDAARKRLITAQRDVDQVALARARRRFVARVAQGPHRPHRRLLDHARSA